MMRSIFVAAIAMAALGNASYAQTAASGHLERERERVESQRKQVFGKDSADYKARVGQMPSDADIKRVMPKVEKERKEVFGADHPATRNDPNSFPNIAAPARGSLDIESIAKRYEQKSEARKMENLMVFVSFAMPRESLKRAISMANKVGASVVFRGFKNNSLKETSLAIKALDEGGGNVLVNPNAFIKYKVRAVPMVVLAQDGTADNVDAEGCALPDDYASVSGDVSLDYALDEIARHSPRFETIARRYTRQLRGG